MNKHVAFVIVQYKQSVEKLKKQLDKFPVYVIDNSEKNRGYGAAANIGLAQAYINGAAWAVVLNQDVVVLDLENFVKALPEKPAIAGQYTGELDNKRWTTIFPSKKIDYISGSGIAIHEDVYKKIGGFYEKYFMYYEDVDFCIRARRAGFPLVKMQGAWITHVDTKNNHEFYLARNHLLFVFRLAPLRIKLYELMRLPKTVLEYGFRVKPGMTT